MKKFKPEKEGPVDLDNQRGTQVNNIEHVPPVSNSVKTKLEPADKVHEDERVMYTLLGPYCRPRTKRVLLLSLQLREGVAEGLVRNGGLLELAAIGDGMWDSIERKARKDARV
jgi:hypothetical protein